VNAIGSRLDGGIQNGARSTTLLGAEVCRLYLELLDRVQRGQNHEVCAVQKVDRVGIIVDAIQQVVVLRWAQAVGRECA
jgi:hypothetical protein